MTGNQNVTPKLYSPFLVTVATVFGAPIAGSLLLAHNYRVLDKQRAARQCMAWGSIGTVLVLVITYFLPENFPNMAFPVGYTAGMYQVARQLQGAEYASHIASGGAKASAWKAIGIGLACLCCVLVLVFLVACVLPD